MLRGGGDGRVEFIKKRQIIMKEIGGHGLRGNRIFMLDIGGRGLGGRIKKFTINALRIWVDIMTCNLGKL